MGCKILIVEDDKNLNLMLKLILKNKKLDWIIQGAHNGEEALKILESFQPEIILLDIRMPEMDGLEFLRQIASHSQRQKLKIAILTSDSEERTVAQAKELGVDDFWTKPIMPDVLLDKLQRLVDGL